MTWQRRRRLVGAAAVLLGLTAVAVPPGIAEDAPAPLPLTGQVWSGQPTSPDEFAATTPTGCDAGGESSFEYDASGTADGPYPGTFTEHGRVTVGPQTGGPNSFGFATGTVATFSAEFTIVSGDTTIQGSRSLVLTAVADPRATCTGFEDSVVERLADLGALSGLSKEVVVAARYEATIATPEAVFVDRGETTSSMALLEYLRGDCGCFGYSSSFALRMRSDGLTPSQPADVTPPTVWGVADRPPDGDGWYRRPVTIHWSATDDSGSTSTPPPTLADVEGAAVVYASEPAVDGAANEATGSYSVSLDRTPPAVTIAGLDRSSFVVGEAMPSPACTAADSLSGLADPCTGSLSGGTTGGVGPFVYSARAADRAGNVGAATATFRVVYGFDGFLQPVERTAHDHGSWSVFKAGSTVPLKFRLHRADGAVATPAVAPRWMAPVRTGAMGDPINETASGVPTVGDDYRYDADSEQWIFNWQTSKDQAGSYWRVGVALDDGTTHTVIIGLR